MKAIIPVAGAGTKLRPLTYTQPKALIPIAGKTILSVIVDQLLAAGVDEFVFVIGYLGEKIQHYVEKHYPHIKYSIVNQADRNGTGHAIWLTKEAVQNDDVIIVFGDTLCDYNLEKVIASATSQIGVKKVDDPRLFGVAELDELDRVLKVVEKPLIPKSNMALVGLYKINETAVLFECLHQLFVENITTRGEYNLTDALACMIQKGIRFRSFKVANWFDCGKKESILETNATLLKKMGGHVPAADIYKDTIIIHPVSIAAGCTISNAIIGPHVAIGPNTTITQSIIRDSIIGGYTNLHEVVLDNSLIGSDASVKGLSRSLNIGDNTEIDFG